MWKSVSPRLGRKIKFYVIINLDESYSPEGMLTLEMEFGSVLLIFHSSDSAGRALASPFVNQIIQDGGGPKAVIELQSASIPKWRESVVAIDPDFARVILLEEEGPGWSSVIESLHG